MLWGGAWLFHLHIPLVHPGQQRQPKAFIHRCNHPKELHVVFTIFTWKVVSLSFQFQEQLLVLISSVTHPQTKLNQNLQPTPTGASSSVKSTELKAGAEGAEPLSSYLTSMYFCVWPHSITSNALIRQTIFFIFFPCLWPQQLHIRSHADGS